jgi:hypothetical protein
VREEQKAFLESNPWIDFYIEREGEKPFLDLLETLAKHD